MAGLDYTVNVMSKLIVINKCKVYSKKISIYQDGRLIKQFINSHSDIQVMVQNSSRIEIVIKNNINSVVLFFKYLFFYLNGLSNNDMIASLTRVEKITYTSTSQPKAIVYTEDAQEMTDSQDYHYTVEQKSQTGCLVIALLTITIVVLYSLYLLYFAK